VLLVSIGGLSLCPSAARAQQPLGTVLDTTELAFLGFRPGLTLVALQDHATQIGRGSFGCRRAASDLRLSECRAGLPELDSGRSVDVWISLIDGRAAITTLSGRLTEARFSRWRELLEGRYGATPEVRRGPMRMLQWIKNGRMLRLSWRAKGRDVEASVSLIDGPLLDGWANVGKRAKS
jgi:hypothetical protein